MSMPMTFYAFATYLEDTYGAYFDREEGFVECPECGGEPIYNCDWEVSDYTKVLENGDVVLVCPICESILSEVD